MAHGTRMTGGIEVVALCDAVGPMKPSLRRPLPETFPGTSPGDFAGEPWVLHFHCYLLRDRRGRTALVDAGIGTAGSPAESWAPTPGRLREELAGAGGDLVIQVGGPVGGGMVVGRSWRVIIRHVAANGQPDREQLLYDIGASSALVSEGFSERSGYLGVFNRLCPSHVDCPRWARSASPTFAHGC